MIIKVTGNDTPQPLALFRHRAVSYPFQLLLNLLDLLPQSFGNGFPQYRETSILSSTRTDMGKAQKLKCLRPPFTSFRPVFLSKTAKLYKTGLLRIQLQPKLTHAYLQLLVKRFSITSVLKTHHEVICISHNVDLAPCMTLSPRFHP